LNKRWKITNLKVGDIIPPEFEEIVLHAKFKGKPIKKILKIEIDFELEEKCKKKQ